MHTPRSPSPLRYNPAMRLYILLAALAFGALVAALLVRQPACETVYIADTIAIAGRCW